MKAHDTAGTGGTIPYTLKRLRRSRRVRISVKDGKVLVTAPARFPLGQLQAFVQENTSWIEKTLTWHRSYQKPLLTDGVAQPRYSTCKGRTLKLVKERIEHYNRHYHHTFARVVIKNHTTRWGSCSKQGNVNFNYRLLFLPLPLVDYVVVHELCHLRELNHSKKFWALVAETIPDYASRKRELQTYHLGGT